MIRIALGFLFTLSTIFANSQVAEKVGAAYRRFAADPQMKYASHSLLVVETKTGKTVFSSNENTGLAPASTLKVITAATALQILGQGFSFQTPLLLAGDVSNGVLNGDIIIKASGDPTTGSWRYASTKDFSQIAQISDAMEKAGIKKWNGSFLVDYGKFGTQGTPGGWTFDDMGNYYGAGVHGFNWYENQYDLVLNPGSTEGQAVKISGTRPIPNAANLTNELSSGPKGSGDNAIIFPDGALDGTVRGTVPAGAKEFVISGSIDDPVAYFQKSLQDHANKRGFPLLKPATVKATPSGGTTHGGKSLTILKSPGIDSIVYFFLQKSVNLYGEALVKQLALMAGKEATTEEGIKWLREYWLGKGIERGAMRIVDGSGLSPHNRVTTRTLVNVMQDAKVQAWYPAFYEGLPVINGIKMKSGSIGGVRGYTGYVKSANGTEYTFAFLVNNFDGTSSAVMQKMFTVLNTLK
jgi:serine-type D-Ala-D-Ala carboxypeptidase/endopeptidase (penicillin-binding protein 4)